jgi:hypothetical protein
MIELDYHRITTLNELIDSKAANVTKRNTIRHYGFLMLELRAKLSLAKKKKKIKTESHQTSGLN